MPYKERQEHEKKKKGAPPIGLQMRSGKRRALDLVETTMLATPHRKSPDPELTDRDNAFLVFCSFSGDLARTAQHLNSTPDAVAQVAQEDNWLEKAKPLIAFKKFGNPAEAERHVNRTVNFLQATQLRKVLEAVVVYLSRMPNDKLMEYCLEESTDKDGRKVMKVHTRPFADLAAALEKVHALSYAALNDTVTERGHRQRSNPDDEPVAVSDIHAALAKAFSDRQCPSELLVTSSVEAEVKQLEGKTIPEILRTDGRPDAPLPPTSPTMKP